LHFSIVLKCPECLIIRHKKTKKQGVAYTALVRPRVEYAAAVGVSPSKERCEECGNHPEADSQIR